MTDYVIEMPVFGAKYIDTAVRWTFPALHAALRNTDGQVMFFVHTDDEAAIRSAIGDDYPVHFFKLYNDTPKRVFVAAHYEALLNTPTGMVTVLMNADIVVCRNFFCALDRIFANPTIKVAASLGVRANLDHLNPPPIGADTQELMRWGWDHRHPLTERALYPHGNIVAQMFFSDGDNVSGHSVCLTPMAVRHDRFYVPIVPLPSGKQVPLFCTIDDGFLDPYADEDIYFVRNGEYAYVELSGPDKVCEDAAVPMTVESVADWFKRRKTRPSSWRNLRQQITIAGAPTADNQFITRLLSHVEMVG